MHRALQTAVSSLYISNQSTVTSNLINITRQGSLTVQCVCVCVVQWEGGEINTQLKGPDRPCPTATESTEEVQTR